VTHDETLAAKADRVIRMADGRIVSDSGKASAGTRAAAMPA